jgi:prepilin peptidase CpaA
MIGPTALSLSVAVALGVFAFLLFLHARGGLGGGDVKLAAAVCVGLPPAEVWRFIIVTSLAGGILAVLHLLGRLALRRSGASPPAPAGSSPLIRVLRTERWRIARGGPLSYGVAIACGGIWAILESRGF